MKGKGERSVKTCSKNAPSWGIDELLNEMIERIRGYTHQEILFSSREKGKQPAGVERKEVGGTRSVTMDHKGVSVTFHFLNMLP